MSPVPLKNDLDNILSDDLRASVIQKLTLARTDLKIDNTGMGIVGCIYSSIDSLSPYNAYSYS